MRLREITSNAKATIDSVAKEDKCTDLAVRDKGVAARSRFKEFGECVIKALVVVVFLSFARNCSPILPAWVLPVIFLIYAVPATMGSMYDVVTTRLHKQDLYNESGKLSRYNRRWFIWSGSFFTVYLVSSVLFVLQSPSWNPKEWLLLYAAPLIFYGIFLVLQRFFKKEYSAKYYKARAIRWSVIVSALLLTVIYMLIAAQPPTNIQIDLNEIIQERYLPYKDSPAAFLGELDKLTTYANCLTEYGINKIAGASYVVSAIVNIIVGFPVFFGVVSLFSACLLTKQELWSEFKLLPAHEGKDENVQVRYIVILFVIWVVFSGVFVWLNSLAEEARATDEYTAIDQWVADISQWIILAVKEDSDVVIDDHEAEEAAREFETIFAAKKNAFVDAQLPSVHDQINAYYDECISKIDGYVEWCESVPASAIRIIPIIGENSMRDEFKKQVIDSVSSDGIDSQYGIFLDGLKDLYNEYWNSEVISARHLQGQSQTAQDVVIAKNIPCEPVLWPSWDGEEGKEFVQNVLLGKASSADSRPTRDRIIDYVEKQRINALSLADSLPGKFFRSTS
ncbi:hypothetical protein [Adlercreutzia sp. ZJ154]|uniref:hypothetical protein n=1 Tax=Adlercreutzia sp. ZJ154 TaxID=2709790 RepID=UPI0013ECB70B|nr:hypothetical protein [Adlercreutzia sp. ZJ154]